MAQKVGKEGSVAPKERVNIRYKTYIGDAVEEIELPMRFLVLGDFTGRPDDTLLEERKVINVDKDNFDEVLAGQKVTAKMNVPNMLSEEENDEMSVSLRFERMKDFSPERVVEQVPELKKLVELRDALSILKGPLGNVPAFRRRLQAIVDDPEAQRKMMEELNLEEKDKKE
jgi:type VI secretion system protein ImpB